MKPLFGLGDDAWIESGNPGEMLPIHRYSLRHHELAHDYAKKYSAKLIKSVRDHFDTFGHLSRRIEHIIDSEVYE